MAERNYGPLKGLKVIELAHIMAGPVCGMMLADMGADVIKVEKTPGGDDTRRMTPPDIEGEAAAYMILNRNKRAVTINLKTEEGKAALREMLRTADVVIENYRLGTLEKLGLGYEDLKKLNPGLIYCQITGFGNTGPYKDRAGFDLIAQGMAGLMSLTGEGPGRPPVKVGVPVGDVSAGVLLAMGVLAAYINRQKTGLGQKVDTSLLEASMIFTYWPAAIYLATGVSPGPMGSAHPISAPYQAFQTKDGWINVGAANQATWVALTEAIGHPELQQDSRFEVNKGRRTHLEELVEVLTPIFLERTTDEWLQRLDAAGCPAGPVLNVGQMLNDPQVLHRKMVVEVDHPRIGKVKTLGFPVKFSDTPAAIQTAAPILGQHTREVLHEYGFTDADIDRMIAAGAAQEGKV